MPPNVILRRDMTEKLEINFEYLKKCRVFHHGMDLAVKQIKVFIIK